MALQNLSVCKSLNSKFGVKTTALLWLLLVNTAFRDARVAYVSESYAASCTNELIQNTVFLFFFPLTIPFTCLKRVEKGPGSSGTKWMYVEFSDCYSVQGINVSAIQAALARWINEECAAALECNLDGKLAPLNVLVGDVFCGTPANFITLVVLKNATDAAFLEGHFYFLRLSFLLVTAVNVRKTNNVYQIIF